MGALSQCQEDIGTLQVQLATAEANSQDTSHLDLQDVSLGNK
jgi:hypothetical protein